MNTQDENIAAATREADASVQRQQVRRGDLEWARQWREGEAQCPCCGGSEFGIPDVKYEDHARYETFRCISCSAHWKVELRETALVVVRDDIDNEDEWIELDQFN
jgi:hypothetical protein